MAKAKKRTRNKSRQGAMSLVERRKFERNMRQLYIWRYSSEHGAQSRQEKGMTAEPDAQGYNLLAPAHRDKVDAAYTVATHTRQHWQVVAIAYCRDKNGDEFRLWAWARSGAPITAARDGIVPLLNEAHRQSVSDLDDSDTCEARAVIMAPWDARHPVRPDVLAARLKQPLKLMDHELTDLASWGEPCVSRVSGADTLDLEVAEALRGDIATQEHSEQEPH